MPLQFFLLYVRTVLPQQQLLDLRYPRGHDTLHQGKQLLEVSERPDLSRESQLEIPVGFDRAVLDVEILHQVIHGHVGQGEYAITWQNQKMLHWDVFRNQSPNEGVVLLPLAFLPLVNLLLAADVPALGLLVVLLPVLPNN